jgi:hypothetical protein
MSQVVKKWRQKNRPHYNRWMRSYRNVDWKQIERMLKDPEEYLFEREYRKRRAVKQATPVWADRGAIRRVYMEAVRLSRQMGIGMRVIHVSPIRGRKVSGLHLAENLKVVSESYAERYRG